MRPVLWTLQTVLAALFLAIGSTKVLQTTEEAIASQPEFADFPGWLITVIGVVEIAGALGLLLPSLTRILPILTPVAAVGLALTMTFAALFHLVRGEYGDIAVTLTFVIPLGLVAWARSGRWSIDPR